MQIRTAASMKVERLYRYQRFSAERLKSLLETDKLYCSTPNDFNDPRDCRPYVNERQLDRPEALEKHMKWFEQADRKHRPKADEEHRRMAEAMRRNPQKVKAMVKEVSAGIGSDIDKRYGVCCFTTKPGSILRAGWRNSDRVSNWGGYLNAASP